MKDNRERQYLGTPARTMEILNMGRMDAIWYFLAWVSRPRLSGLRFPERAAPFLSGEIQESLAESSELPLAEPRS